MSDVEVLVACMFQDDDALYKTMNLQTNAVLANQAEEYSLKEFIQKNGDIVKLVTSADRGVGKNRNKALMNASGKYLLFADQDMVYVDGYEKIICDAFEKRPDADIIAFNLNYLNRFTPAHESGSKFKRVHIWSSMRYGTAKIAIKKSSIEKANLSFSTLYGGGAPFSAGEDSLFIREAFSKKLRMYYCPAIIADVKQETSSWFKGYNDKYFIDKGILLANMFPWAKHLLIYYFAYQMRNVSEKYSFNRICILMREGFRIFDNL